MFIQIRYLCMNLLPSWCSFVHKLQNKIDAKFCLRMIRNDVMQWEMGADEIFLKNSCILVVLFAASKLEFCQNSFRTHYCMRWALEISQKSLKVTRVHQCLQDWHIQTRMHCVWLIFHVKNVFYFFFSREIIHLFIIKTKWIAKIFMKRSYILGFHFG